MRVNANFTNRLTLAGLAAIALLAGGCKGEVGRQGPEGPEGPAGVPGELDPALTTWEKAMAGIGGEAELAALTGFAIEASGMRYHAGETYAVDDPAMVVDQFDTTTSSEIDGAKIRIDYARNILFAGGIPLTYSEIINGQLGYVDGDDSFFGPAFSTNEMPSSRWASSRKQQMFLNPHWLLKAVMDGDVTGDEAGVGLHNGAIHELYEIDDAVYPITLWVNASTGRIGKLTTMVNDHLHRDVELEFHYHGWQATDAGVYFPAEVFIVLDGHIVHEEYRSSVTVNPALVPELFNFPDGANPTYDADSAAWGEASQQFHQGFLSLGLPLDVQQSYVQATELTTGVWFLTGGSHNSVVVEQANGVVVIEPPLYPERSAAILDWIAGEASIENKTVTHVVVSHHHEDHAGGLREFVAAGATPVASVRSADYFAKVLRARSTIAPDTLSENPRNPAFETVEVAGWHAIEDGSNPVEVYHLPSGHADDLLVVHLPNGGFLFESDLYNPGNGGAALVRDFALELWNFISDEGLAVTTLVGGHGATGALSELQDYLFPPAP